MSSHQLEGIKTTFQSESEVIRSGEFAFDNGVLLRCIADSVESGDGSEHYSIFVDHIEYKVLEASAYGKEVNYDELGSLFIKNLMSMGFDDFESELHWQSYCVPRGIDSEIGILDVSN